MNMTGSIKGGNNIVVQHLANLELEERKYQNHWKKSRAVITATNIKRQRAGKITLSTNACKK
jgi:hypothetical protein